MTEQFTKKQGQYLAFIYNYSVIHGRPPAESDLQMFFDVTSPTVHQMIMSLDAKDLISKIPGKARSITLNIDPAMLPRLVRVI